MKIVYDFLNAQPQGTVKYHGGGEYIKSVFTHLIQETKESNNVIVCYDTNKFLDDYLIDLFKQKKIQVQHVKETHDIITFANKLAEKDLVRLFAGMIYTYDNNSFAENVYSIGTCHGLRFLELSTDKEEWRYCNGAKDICKWVIKRYFMKNYFENRHRNMYEKAMEGFDEIIVASEHSKYAVLSGLNNHYSPEDIPILYPITRRSEYVPSQITSSSYIMMINANRWEKNSFRGLRSIDNLFSKGELKKHHVKVFGKCPKHVRRSLKNLNRFQFYDYVDNNELENAFANCDLFLYPTLNEGFGTPPLEAMKYGKTCAISAVCSLPEIYKDYVYYFNPYDIKEIEGRVLQAINNKLPIEKVLYRYDEIVKQQDTDMKLLCKKIIGD